jgi:hypothetical protein
MVGEQLASYDTISFVKWLKMSFHLQLAEFFIFQKLIQTFASLSGPIKTRAPQLSF